MLCLNVLYCVELIHIDIGRLADKAEIFLIRILQQSAGYPQALETKILFHLPSPIQFIILGLQSFRVLLRPIVFGILFVFISLSFFAIRFIYRKSSEGVLPSLCRERKLQILSIFIQCRTWIKKGAKNGK